MAPGMDQVVERYLDVLRQLIERSGLSLRELERRLTWAVGTISRLLAGGAALRVDQVLALLRGLEVEPLVFYRLVHDQEASLESLSEGASAVRQPSPIILPPALTRDELRQCLEEAVLQAIQRLRGSQG